LNLYIFFCLPIIHPEFFYSGITRNFFLVWVFPLVDYIKGTSSGVIDVLFIQLYRQTWRNLVLSCSFLLFKISPVNSLKNCQQQKERVHSFSESLTYFYSSLLMRHFCAKQIHQNLPSWVDAKNITWTTFLCCSFIISSSCFFFVLFCLLTRGNGPWHDDPREFSSPLHIHLNEETNLVRLFIIHTSFSDTVPVGMR
jgi:hypothetical protein